MKKTILTVKKDLYINFTTIGIVSSIIIGLIIIGICGIYTDGEGRTFNCISIFSTYNKTELLQMHLMGETIFLNLLKSLAPYGMMLAAFSFAFGMYAEKQNKTTKYVIYRTGIKRYVISKALLAFISSVFVMGIIAIICAIYIHGRFPAISEADSEFIEFKMQSSGYSDTGRKLNLVSQMGFGAAYLYGIFGMMLYGGLCASIGFIVYALTKDIYFNICLPFFVGYGQNVLVNYCIFNKPEIGRKMQNTGYLSYYLRIPYNEKRLLVNLLIFVGIWVLAIVINIAKIRSVKDYGGDL